MQYLIFDLGGTNFGIPMDLVREVLKSPEVTPFPQCPDFIKGVIYLRKHNIAVMDLSKRFGIPAEGEKKAGHVIMVRLGKIIMGLLVHKVQDILEVPEVAIDTTSKVAGGFLPPQAVSGVARVKDQTMMLLNLDTILNPEECGALEKASG